MSAIGPGSSRGSLTVDGCPLAYVLEGDGPPVVFIQGVGVHGDGWLPQTDALRDRFRTLRFDNRGMGASVPAAAPITVERMAADTLALMDHVGFESAHLVGHSLGGPVAIETALIARGRVRSLCLLNTMARGGDATRPRPRLIWSGARSRIGPRRSRRRAFLEIVLSPAARAARDVDDWNVELTPLFGHDLAVQPPVAMTQLAALRAWDGTARLHELAGIPTLVMSARFDPIAPPRVGRKLAEGIPGARLVPFQDAAHGLPIEHPDRTNLLLAEHFTSA